MPPENVAMTDAQTPPPSPPQSFATQLAATRRLSNWQELPPPGIAMWPGIRRSSDDISDRTQFNERFIESRVNTGRGAFFIQLCSMGISIFFLTLLYLFYLDFSSNEPFRTVDLLGYGICIIFILILSFFAWLTIHTSSSDPVRFNRQAQVVQIPWGINGEECLTLPWREVHPFIEYDPISEGGYFLRLGFPLPSGGPTLDGQLFTVPGGFDGSDFMSFSGALWRYEFIRRYMEEGLEAITPDPALVKKGMIRKPTGFDAEVNEIDGWGFRLFYYTLYQPFYWLTFGPLIDWYLKRRERSFRWPEEVERLSAPGADLSGYDTTPVVARTDLFYRFDYPNVVSLVDRHGNGVSIKRNNDQKTP